MTKVTTKSYWGYYWSPIITKIWAKTDIKKSFFAQRAKKKALAEGWSPPQELQEGPRSGPHLLVKKNSERQRKVE